MTTASLIFFIVFAIPLVLALVWLLRQDTRRKSAIGLFIVGILVLIAVIVALYVGTNSNSG